jgi:hypothetical protein
MPAAGDAGTEFEEVKFPTDLEGELLAGLGEGQGTAVITAYRQFDDGAG